MELDDVDKSGESDEEIEDSRMQSYVKRMSSFRDNLYADAKDRIVESQLRQKRDYDKKHGKNKVLYIASYKMQI